ncbi:MAG: tetratricopeptide repeat protein, partial [Pseudomonadota bacterium]
SNLGSTLKKQGKLEEAIASCQRAIALNPGYAEAYSNLSSALHEQGKLDEAIACCQQALAIDPNNLDAHNNMGNALEAQGKLDEAVACYRRALAIQPDSSTSHFNLGNELRAMGKWDDAVSSFERALQLKPDFAYALNGLGIALQGQGKLSQAVDCYRRALQAAPDYANAYNNLGIALQGQGKLDEAIAAYRQALQLQAEFPQVDSNMLFCYNYHPTYTADHIYTVYQDWNARCAARFALAIPTFNNLRAPHKRLRIGYVSADFSNHSVIHFVAPLIERHDKSQFEVICYYNRFINDASTARIMAAADQFIPCMAMSDDELAQRIRNDGIDVLIDLGGHTEGNRLLVFARKPAPVQASWLGFGYTTGLTTMDYLIGDPVFTPAGAEALFSEAIYRLPHTAWVYQPPAAAPEPGPSPAQRNGYITFGCLSRSERINAPMIDAWAAILQRLPTARLRLDSKNFTDDDLCRQIEAKFAVHGIAPQQLQLGYTSPVWSVYQEVDIVLDCFPHNSGTTTYEALWMGIPVITLAARPSVGRMGASIVSSIGHSEWIAADVDQYVALAVATAQDLPALLETRATLRGAMQASPLLDQAGFVGSMETAYRNMWQSWCANAPQDDGVLLQTAMELHKAGQLQQAGEIYRSMPANPDAIHLLGVMASQLGDQLLAIQTIGRAIGLNPGNAAFHCNLGGAYHALKRWDEAAASYRQALSISPNYALAHNNLGNTLKDQGRPSEAVASYQKALQLQPDYVEALNNLGAIYKDLGQLDQAVASYMQALTLRPNFPEAHYNLGNAFSSQIKLKEAAFCYETALVLKPDFYRAHSNLGLNFKDNGKISEAIACFEKALAIQPDFVEANSNLLFCHNYHPTHSAQEIFGAYQRWNQSQAQHLAPDVVASAHLDYLPDPQRRLKIGYVSGDFHHHSVMLFAGAAIEDYDRSHFEVFCYSNREIDDAQSARVKSAVDHWIPCQQLSDEAMAQRIRADRIDILIDLSGHTLGHRLLVFARKPAPVQASWLGFGYTTGLTTMDYFIGDPLLTPPGCEEFFSETIYRLPHCFAVYQPPSECPEPDALPALRKGAITFGCLSRTERINELVIDAWSAILRCLPSARLRLDSKNLRDDSLRKELEQKFIALGVAREQLQFGYTSPVWSVYQEVDIVLDCFPHNSGTTTYEALWMGIPVITLAGRPSVGRMGASILGNLGKPEWIASDCDDYVERAVKLAQDIPALAHLRTTLRQSMRGSPLMDRHGFVTELETAYRTMWAAWCEHQKQQHGKERSFA